MAVPCFCGILVLSLNHDLLDCLALCSPHEVHPGREAADVIRAGSEVKHLAAVDREQGGRMKAGG